MTRMLIVGPQGSGKGTQAKLISEKLGIVAISTGDIFRANIKGETDLGKEAKKYVDAGDLVPDSLTNRLIEDRLGWEDAVNGFLLDGYPRNRTQAATLDEILSRLQVDLDLVLELTADTDELTQRLKKRAEIEGREDDADENVIRRRLELFENETRPMIDEFKTRGFVKQVDGLGPVDEVNARIMTAIRG